MKLKLLLLQFILILIVSAQTKQLQQNIGNLELTSGKTIVDCTIGYRTIGKINSDSTNVIIIPTWFGGTTEYSAKLVGPGRLVDSTDYFFILLDALGNGISSSPSNSLLGQGKSFPEITIEDMVNSQYILLTKYLKIKKVFAAIGGSMGGMQMFQWIVSYPDFIQKAVPYVSSPRRSNYDQLMMRFKKMLIEDYRSLGADEKMILKIFNFTDEIFGRSPEYIIDNTSSDSLAEYLNEVENRERVKTFGVDNYLAQLNAMITHNIYRRFDNSVKKTAENIKAKLFLILGSTDHLVHPSTALELAAELNCVVLKLENNCGHLSVGCELKRCAEAIKSFLKEN